VGAFFRGVHKGQEVFTGFFPFAKAFDMLRVDAAGDKRKAGIKRPR
jgi:hypothetical protein